MIKKLLDYYFKETPISVFDALKDKSAIASLNINEEMFLYGGDVLYDYLANGILHSIELNKDYNFDHPVSVKVAGKKKYVLPSEEFKKY